MVMTVMEELIGDNNHINMKQLEKAVKEERLVQVGMEYYLELLVHLEEED
jgi:hypothetical protein